MVFAAANLGGVVLPVVIGRLVDASSPGVIPTTILATALACLAATVALRRSASDRRARRDLSRTGGPGPSPGRR